MKQLKNKGSSIKPHLSFAQGGKVPLIHPDFANVENTIGEPMDSNYAERPRVKRERVNGVEVQVKRTK